MNALMFEIISIVIAFIAFIFAGWLYKWVEKQPSSNAKIAQVGGLIRQGAKTFLNKEYRVLARFAGVAAVLILVFLPSPIWKGEYMQNILMALSYIAGTVFSAIAGKIGIQIATIANIKAAKLPKMELTVFMAGSGVAPLWVWL